MYFLVFIFFPTSSHKWYFRDFYVDKYLAGWLSGLFWWPPSDWKSKFQLPFSFSLWNAIVLIIRYITCLNKEYRSQCNLSCYQIGTDIEDFKCSWLVVKALECCNEEQKKILFVSKELISSASSVAIFYKIYSIIRVLLPLLPGELRESRSSQCCKGEGAL